ncbi:MAG TPA: SHOCT domain-containing protein [Propionicimonas sp.]
MSVEGDLKGATKGWKLPTIVREYGQDSGGQKRFQEEAAILAKYNYLPHTQSTESGHTHVGRVIGTLGVAAVLGKGSSKAKTTVTYQNAALTPEGRAAAEAAKAGAASASKTEAMEQLKSLTELRDMGAISADEYEKKRKDLMKRF